MSWALGLLALLQGAPDTFDSNAYYETWSRKEVREKIEECGFEQVRVYKNERKATVVRVDDKSASLEELRCAAERIDKTFYGHEFSAELAPLFAQIIAEVARPRQIAQAKARFAKEPERGLPPERTPGETDRSLATRIEAFCGPKAAGSLLTDHPVTGGVTLSPDWMQGYSASLDEMVEMSQVFGCLRQAAVIADLEVGFIGNDVAAGSAD